MLLEKSRLHVRKRGILASGDECFALELPGRELARHKPGSQAEQRVLGTPNESRAASISNRRKEKRQSGPAPMAPTAASLTHEIKGGSSPQLCLTASSS